MAEVDATGRYRIDGLGEGTYRVSVFQLPTSGGGGPSVSAPQQAAVTIGETTTVDFQLGGGTAVHGRVLQAGAPVPGARVELSAVEGPLGSRVSTVADQGGVYRLDGVVPGSYVARIDRSSQRVDIPDVEDLELDLEVPSGAIAGRVLDAATGAPVADARIVALRADEAEPGAEFHPWARAGTGSSGPDGAFEVTGLAAGTYDLTVSHESHASATASAEVPAGGRREGVEVRLTGGVAVSGRVLDVRVGEHRLLDVQIGDDLLEIVLGQDRDALGVPRTGEGCGEGPRVDARDLGRGEGDHLHPPGTLSHGAIRPLIP